MEDVKKWQALPDEEKDKVLKTFLQRLNGLNYKDICKRHDLMTEADMGTYAYKHPVLVLRLADEKMSHQIMNWLYSTVDTSQGEMHVPLFGYFLDEIVFDKSSLMSYDDHEKEILRQAIRIIQEKGTGKEKQP